MTTASRGLVLIADDDPDTRHILRLVLEHGGYESLESTTAEAALVAAQQRQFALFIVNCPLFDKEGVTVCERLRSTERTRGVPILNLTSRPLPHVLSYACDVDVSLAKPVELSALLRIINSVVRTRPRETCCASGANER